MKKIIFGLLLLISAASFGQSSLYNNAIINLKDPRSSSVYSFGWLNNIDSIATMDSVGLRMIRPLRFKPLTTAQLPAFATAGMVVYCSDSTALLFHNGTAWVKISAATGGGSTPTFQQVLTQGSTLTTNNTVTLGTNTYSYNSNSAVKLHIDANGRVSVGGTNNSANQFYVNGTMGAADGSVLFSFAAASLQYYCPSSDMIIRLNGQSEEWRITKATSEFVIYPVTTNADPFRIKDNALNTRFQVDFATPKVGIYGAFELDLGSDASYDTYYRNSSGDFQRLANGTTGQVLTATTGSAPSWAAPSNIYSADGTLSGNRVVSGAESYDINFNTVDTFGVQGNAVYLNPVTNTSVGGAFGLFSKQTITSGTATTITNNVSRVLVNPGSVLASHTITLPASPHDGDEVRIFFGGTIAGGATVVTSLTISANSGQTLIQPTTPSTAVGGDCIIYSYNLSNTTWYRVR